MRLLQKNGTGTEIELALVLKKTTTTWYCVRCDWQWEKNETSTKPIMSPTLRRWQCDEMRLPQKDGTDTETGMRKRWERSRNRDETEKEMRQGLRQWWDTLRQELRKPTCSCISPHCNINQKPPVLDGISTETEMRDTDVRQRSHSYRNGAEMRWNWERDGTGTEIVRWMTLHSSWGKPPLYVTSQSQLPTFI